MMVVGNGSRDETHLDYGAAIGNGLIMMTMWITVPLSGMGQGRRPMESMVLLVIDGSRDRRPM